MFHEAALEDSAETSRIEFGHRIVDPTLPEDPGTVHILDTKTRAFSSNDRIIDGVRYTNYRGQFALCGVHVQVVLPIALNPTIQTRAQNASP